MPARTTVEGEARGDDVIRDLGRIADSVRERFGRATAQQLNWKPDAGEWSIAQCLEHLMLVNGEYFPLLARIARGDWRPSVAARLPLLPRLFGALILATVQPETRRKVQARPRFVPSSSTIAGDIVERFVAHQQALCEHIAATGGTDWDRTIITSPIARVVTYSLADAYRIIVAHERQHLAQAERVRSSPGFPPYQRGP